MSKKTPDWCKDYVYLPVGRTYLQTRHWGMMSIDAFNDAVFKDYWAWMIKTYSHDPDYESTPHTVNMSNRFTPFVWTQDELNKLKKDHEMLDRTLH